LIGDSTKYRRLLKYWTMAKGKPSAIEVGDELVLLVVRVDDEEYSPTVTFALGSGQRFTIRQDSADIAEVRKVPKERGRSKTTLFEEPD
jgi:hypothetical protein